MIIAIIHERCTMEESEPAFNQFVTLEQNQSKKKKIITKKHLILIKSLHPSNSSKTTNEPKSLALDFHLDLREKDRSRALLWPEKDGQRKISLSKGSQITKITLRHRRIRCCIFATSRDNAILSVLRSSLSPCCSFRRRWGKRRTVSVPLVHRSRNSNTKIRTVRIRTHENRQLKRYLREIELLVSLSLSPFLENSTTDWISIRWIKFNWLLNACRDRW